MYETCKTLLPRAADQRFTIDDVAVNDVTLLEVLDLDQFLEAGELNDPEVAGFILLHLDPAKIRLVAAGPRRGFTVVRSKKAEFRDLLDPPQTRLQQESSPKVVELVVLPALSIIRGSNCICPHLGGYVNICK